MTFRILCTLLRQRCCCTSLFCTLCKQTARNLADMFPEDKQRNHFPHYVVVLNERPFIHCCNLSVDLFKWKRNTKNSRVVGFENKNRTIFYQENEQQQKGIKTLFDVHIHWIYFSGRTSDATCSVNRTCLSDATIGAFGGSSGRELPFRAKVAFPSGNGKSSCGAFLTRCRAASRDHPFRTKQAVHSSGRWLICSLAEKGRWIFF